MSLSFRALYFFSWVVSLAICATLVSKPDGEPSSGNSVRLTTRHDSKSASLSGFGILERIDHDDRIEWDTCKSVPVASLLRRHALAKAN